jgi:hypothetical protein
MMQPIVSDDVGLEEPLNGAVELASPEPIRLNELVRQFLSVTHDARQVTTDPQARYFGAAVTDRSLTPGANARIGETSYANWLERFFS